MASAMTTVVEGTVHYRHKRKWRVRWCVIKKPSPVADRLQVILYKERKDVLKGGAKSSFPVEGFFGLESGFTLDKQNNVLAVICQRQVHLFAFPSKEILILFEVRIRASLGEEQQFPVHVVKAPSHSPLQNERMRMLIHGNAFCLTARVPPKILMSWNLSDLRRYGPVDEKFVLEGGSRCGKGSGLHVLLTNQAIDIMNVLQWASVGRNPLHTGAIHRRSQAASIMDYLTSLDSDNTKSRFMPLRQPATAPVRPEFDETNRSMKRHSISVTDWQWRSSSDVDKQRLISIENIDRARLLALYDIPPRRIRPVEKNENDVLFPQPLQDQRARKNTRSVCDDVVDSCPNVIVVHSDSMPNLNQDDEHHHLNNSCLNKNSNHKPDLVEIFDLHPHVSREEYDGDLDDDSVFEIDEISLVNMADDKAEVTGLSPDNTRTTLVTVESSPMQQLIQTEEDLQRELALLDEMLQACQSDKPSISDVNLNKNPSNMQSRCSLSLQNHSEAKLVIEGMVHDGSSNSTKKAKSGAQNLVTDVGADRNNVFRYDSVESSKLLSPNLLGKIEQIPHNSKLAVPLQYVNLDKYDIVDDNVTNTHVYFPPLSSSAEEQKTGLLYPYDNMNPSLQSNVNRQNTCTNHNIPTSVTCVKPVVPNRRKSSDSEILLLPPAPPPPLPPEDPPERPPRVVKSDLPPPQLPPKVPSLLRKHSDYINPTNAAHSSKATDFIFVDRSKKPHRTLQQIPEQNTETQLPLPANESNYMMMTPAEADSDAQRRLNDSKISNEGDIDEQTSIYMPMSGPHESALHISLSAPKLSRISSLDTGFIADDSYTNMTSPHRASKPKFRHSHSVDGQTMSNYMEMSCFDSPSKSHVLHNLEALQSYVRTTPAGASPSTISVSDQQCLDNIDVYSKASSEQLSMSAPFPNLIKFAGYRANKLAMSQKEDMINGENSLSSSDLDKSMNNPSKTSFLSRFLRRSSRGKNSAQSQENLANISLSRENVSSTDKASPVKDDDVVTMTRHTKTGSTCLSRFSLIGAPELVERHRSSSIPNGVCCLESLQSRNDSSTTTNANSTSVSSLDKRLSQSEETLKHLVGVDESERFSHYSQDDQQLPVPDVRSRSDQAKSISADVYSVMDNREFRQKLFKDPDNDFSSQGLCLAKDSSNTCVSSQTDDQKLLALFMAASHSNLIKPLNDENPPSFFANPDMSASNIETYVKTLSPTEQAAAIAKHVTSLAPFIPPKTKTSPTFPPCLKVPNCSASLQAIDTRVTATSNNFRPSSDSNPKQSSASLTVLPSPSAFLDVDCESPTDPASWKRQARENLRIMPPIQDENGNIWIARQNQSFHFSPDRIVGGRSSLVVPHDEASGSKIGGGDTGMSATAQGRVDKLGEVREHIDALSLSHSSFADEAPLRSSPASTILRPRSGKEYRQIDRRGQTVYTCTTTTPTTTTTPRSSGTNSSLVFTFDSPQSPSCRSSQSQERDSPKLSSVYARGGIPTSMGSNRVNHAYVNLGKVSDKSSSLEIYTPYVNVDMTPPSSPNYQLPMEQIDPHLNYAEIDLSSTGHSGSSSSDRSKNKNSSSGKKIQKAATIEYAMIDLVATAAVQKLSKEHAQSRGEDSLRRTGRKFSAPVLARSEKRSNVPLVSRFVERDRKLSTSSCDSNG